MKKSIILLLAILLGGAAIYAEPQDFLKKIGNAIDKAVEVGEKIDKAKKSLPKSQTSGKAKAGAIATGNSDVKGQIVSCWAYEDQVYVDFKLINVSDNELDVVIATDFNSAAYDDRGNEYKFRNDALTVLDTDGLYGCRRGVMLPPGVPVKFRVRILGVPASASTLKSMTLDSYGGAVKQYTFGELPITRE